MKKLLLFLPLTCQLFAMSTRESQTPEKTFTFHSAAPSLRTQALIKTTPENYASKMKRHAKITHNIEVAEKAGQEKKVKRLKKIHAKHYKNVPVNLYQEKLALETDNTKKVEDAFKKDNSDLLKAALLNKQILLTPEPRLFYEEPVNEPNVLYFTELFDRALEHDSVHCAEFLLTHAENIPAKTLFTFFDTAAKKSQTIYGLMQKNYPHFMDEFMTPEGQRLYLESVNRDDNEEFVDNGWRPKGYLEEMTRTNDQARRMLKEWYK